MRLERFSDTAWQGSPQQALCLCLLWALFVAPVAAQQNSPPAPDTSYHVLAITQIAGEPVEAKKILILEDEDKMGGIDIEVRSWNLEPEDRIWLLVNPNDSPHWHCFGPAKKEERRDLWKIYGIRLGHEFSQGKHFTIRAVASAFELWGADSLAHWAKRVRAISEPIRVSIVKRGLMARHANGLGIWIRAINNQTVDPMEAAIVTPSATITGTAGPVYERTDSIPRFVYVVIHPLRTEEWRLSNYTTLEGPEWQIRDVMITQMGEPLWTDFELFAIVTEQKLSPGAIDYSAWRRQTLAASPSIRVFVKSEVMLVDSLRIPAIAITHLKTVDGIQKRIKPERARVVDDLDEVVELSGEVERYPNGSAVYLLMNPVGSPLWMVLDGKAVIKGFNWQFNNFRFVPPGKFNTKYYKCLAVLTNTELIKGACPYEAWRKNALAISPSIIFENNHPVVATRRETEIEIARVAGKKVDPKSAVQVGTSCDFEGYVEGIVDGAAIQIAIHEVGAELWQFKGPAVLAGGEWKIAVVLQASTNGQPKTPKNFEAMAMVTRGHPMVTSGDYATIQSYALATSPLVYIEDGPVLPSSLFHGVNRMNLILILLLILLLLALEYFFRLISTLAARLQEILDAVFSYVKTQFQKLPQPDPVHSVLGVAILSLGLFAIWSYFSIYSHVLQNALNLQRNDSESLAILLITFVGLAGLVFDITQRFGGASYEENSTTAVEAQDSERNDTEDEESDTGDEQPGTSGLQIVLLFAIGIITLCLWLFQATLYYNFYSGQSQDATIARAMGAAAFFIAGIETLVFYWATKLGLNFFAWLLFHGLVLFPAGALAKGVEMIKLIFQNFPSKRENH